MANSDDSKILIMGAGLAGLTLAQCLRKEGIPFQVFERDQAVGSRKQGWAVVLIECLPDCDELLPDDVVDLSPTSVNHNIPDNDEVTIYDPSHDQALLKMGGVAKGEKGYLLRAGREALRQHLWHGFDVITDKNFMSYTEDENGVEAFFADGTSYRGAAIIGADGAHSHVRRQLLQHTNHEALLSSFIPIWGEVELTKSQYAPLEAIANAFLVGAQPGGRFLIGRKNIQPDRSTADYYWNLNFKSDNPAKDSAWASHATKEELYAQSLAITKDWPASIGDLIHKHSSPANMATPPLKLYEFVPPSTFPTGRVTLVGDALHAMVPFKGAGANTSLLDSCDLARILIKNKDHLASASAQDWAEMLKAYETIAIPRGREVGLSSHAAGEDKEELRRYMVERYGAVKA